MRQAARSRRGHRSVIESLASPSVRRDRLPHAQRRPRSRDFAAPNAAAAGVVATAPASAPAASTPAPAPPTWRAARPLRATSCTRRRLRCVAAVRDGGGQAARGAARAARRGPARPQARCRHGARGRPAASSTTLSRAADTTPTRPDTLPPSSKYSMAARPMARVPAYPMAALTAQPSAGTKATIWRATAAAARTRLPRRPPAPSRAPCPKARRRRPRSGAASSPG